MLSPDLPPPGGSVVYTWETLKIAASQARPAMIVARQIFGRSRTKPRVPGKSLDLCAIALLRSLKYPPTLKDGVLRLPYLFPD